jgi:hypothetical protein
LSVTASDQEGISKDLLFFVEAVQPSKSVCYGFLLHQLWFCLRTHHTFWITTELSTMDRAGVFDMPDNRTGKDNIDPVNR